MRPSAPFLGVAIEFFQIENVLVGEAVWALLERRRRGVVQHDEGRSPTRPPQRMAIAIKFFDRMTDADNSFPSHGVNSPVSRSTSLILPQPKDVPTTRSRYSPGHESWRCRTRDQSNRNADGRYDAPTN